MIKLRAHGAPGKWRLQAQTFGGAQISVQAGSFSFEIVHTGLTPMSTDTFRPAQEFSTNCNAAMHQSSSLVTQVMHLRACVGDGLNDFEFTAFAKSKLSADRNGFQMLSLIEGNLTLIVPQQDVRKWYGEKCAIARTQEERARQIAERHQLTLCEPPDKLVYGSPGPGVHRHLEFANRWRTVAVAHPLYLKLRICGGGDHEDLPAESDAAIAQCERLMADLATLYV
jgi:hypothetical protein